ncbi:hypothetical protein [Parablautia muri]|uniref:Uncharacterized protein n=1 Tax=Parablautia muri TaxID=2320879 RepID=A0A9X5BKE7_9FIRM|nr:hypothetical protein [Parablautia muri]NBJ95339.1 hypothetical protein [Parablautia muri]
MGNDIKCMYFNHRFKDKPQGKQCGWVQKSLTQVNITIENLADALVHGASFKPGVLAGGNKAENWIEQQLFGLDFDDGIRIEEAYNKVISLGITPCFMYTTFSHKEEHHKFRMIFCNDAVITDGNIRDKLQATLMGIIGGIDEVCFNRDRLFFGGKGHTVLYPDYDTRINAESIIEKYWNDEFEQYISNAKPKSKKKKDSTAAGIKNKGIDTAKERPTYENLNVKAIKEHDIEYLRKVLAHDPIEFENKNEFWDYIYSELDIAELIDIDDPRSFCCVLHDDHNPSANIFTTQNGIQKYRCCSENLTLNIKQLIELLGDFKSEYKAIQFIMNIYNLSIKESQWSIEQRENIDLMISNITLNKFKELCPQADKNIKYAKDTFLMMLSIARNNIYSEKFSNNDGEIVFYVTNKKLSEYLGKSNSQKKIDKVSKYVKMLVYHDLIRILDNDQIPKELLKNALKYTNGNKNRANFYAIPSWVIQQLNTIENNGVRWKEKGYRIAGVSFDMFYRSEGFDVAASIYPQYKKKKNEYGEIVDRSTTKASDERTLKISEIILQCIQRKGYCTEKEVVYILGNKYRYEVTETQIKRCLNEIMDLYGLKKVKANKALKEQYHIKSNGYPNIIIEDVA